MGHANAVAHDPSVADRVPSHEVRKYRRATSPRWRTGRNMIYPRRLSEMHEADRKTKQPAGGDGGLSGTSQADQLS